MAQDHFALARPWAEAVFKVAVEENTLDVWESVLRLLASAMQQPEFKELLQVPGVGAQALLDVLAHMDPKTQSRQKEMERLFSLLHEKKRLPVAGEILEIFLQLRHEHEKTLPVVVESAYALDKRLLKRLSSWLEERFQKKIETEVLVNPALLGGVLVRAGDVVIDASVQGTLARAHKTLCREKADHKV